MEAQEGGGVTLAIVLVERESVIVRDLPTQGFAAGGGFRVVAHPSRDKRGLPSGASSFPRVLPGFSPPIRAG
jgi:hypothetical protein